MNRRKPMLLRSAISMLAAGLVFLSACAVGVPSEVSTEDIRGLLQAMEGKEMVITLDDGSSVRITVEDAGSAASIRQMVGNEVSARATVSGNQRSLNSVERVGEDEHFTGVIESMGAETWTIGGKVFSVNANTELDGGLAVGVTARVEFVTLPDGSALAAEIETDAEDEQFEGTIESISATSWVIGGQTFVVDAATRIDAGLAAGSPARVEFIVRPDGSLLALEIESDREDDHFSGVIESMVGGNWTIGGRLFIVNAATRLDDGLAVGVKARVEFITLADGSVVATEIETDEAEDRFSGTVNQADATAWVVDNTTFKVSAATRIDSGLGVGSKVRVRFTTLSDGSALATRIQADNRGPGNQKQDFLGVIESISTDTWVISGRSFSITAATRFDSGLEVGSKVRVRFDRLADGSMLAVRIEVDKREREAGEPEQEGAREAHENEKLTGVLESIVPGQVIIAGKTLATDNMTRFDDNLAVGARVKVEFRAQPDGTLVAIEIETEN